MKIETEELKALIPSEDFRKQRFSITENCLLKDMRRRLIQKKLLRESVIIF